MQTVRVEKDDGDLVVIIPSEVAAAVGIVEGARLSIAADEGRLVLSPLPPRYRLADLVAGVTPADFRFDIGWGDDAGRESVPD